MNAPNPNAAACYFFIDLDGTLEDSRADMTAAARRVRARFGLPVWEDERLTPNVNRGMTELYLACFSDFVSAQAAHGVSQTDALERVRLAYEADYGAHIADETRLYEGMKDTIEDLAARGKVICVTNKPEALSRRLLAALGIAASFTDVMGGDSCAECKPSCLPLQIAAERHGFDPARDAAYMIGDSAGDVRCGRAFGAKVIWCAYGYASTPGPEEPDFTAHKPMEILACVGRA